jgi:low temperature requirement protein LtrA
LFAAATKFENHSRWPGSSNLQAGLMALLSARTSHLRVRQAHEHSRVTFVELFFDLVFVFAVTQLSHGLLHHLTLLGAAQTAVLLIAVWWSWIDTAWITNWLDPEKPAVRLMLFALMLAGLVMAAAIPKAFEDRAVAFAGAYVAMQLIRNLFMLWATRRHDPANFRNFRRILVWHLAGAVFGIAGIFFSDLQRLELWTVAAAIETIGPMAGFWVPGLRQSTTADWVVEGGHLAERCGLFIIIALGESVLITGASFADLPWSPVNAAAFTVAFINSAALWAVYFNIGAERGSRQIASSDDPGRLARSGYTYMHILIVAGIIVAAVGDELVLHHPAGHIEVSALVVIVGGSALYLLGNTLFKRLSAPYFPLSHLVGLGLLTLLAVFIFATHVMTPLLLVTAATAVLVVVAVWEWLSLRRRTVP